MLNTQTSYPCTIEDLGLIEYALAWDLQKQFVHRVIAGGPGHLILCEHPPVLTLGRMATEANILFSQEELAKKGVTVAKIDRGGEVTLHSPGQLVIYPIFDLTRHGKDLRLFLEKLEQVAIDFLKDFDILASASAGQRGVWVKNKKIASIGVGVRKWVSYHGIAINLNTDLSLFSLIRPCGLDVSMTSVQALTGAKVDVASAKQRIQEHFARHFHLEFTKEQS